MPEVAVRPPDDLRQFSRWFDMGVTHFLKGLHTPDRMATEYPTRGKYDEQDEADFLAGWNHAKREHEAAQTGEQVEIAGVAEWRVE